MTADGSAPGNARPIQDRRIINLDDSRRTRAPKQSHRRRWLLGLAALVVAAGVAVWGIFERQTTLAKLKATADTEAVPKVTLVSPQHGPASRPLTLPGELRAWYAAPIYAQVAGYVEMWYKDYGAPVRKGELLATIATPDLDQEVQQARARLQVAQTRAALARVTAARWQKLAGTQAVSQETVDVNNAGARAAEAEVQAAQSALGRYEAKEAFKRVVAPFDGVVTARETDIGAYVNGTGGTAGPEGKSQELFTVSDIHEMRVFVSVPQDYSKDIRTGLQAAMTLPQFPGQTFDLTVTTTAMSFDSNTRTVVTELTLPNPRQELWPGAFVQVRFKVPSDPNILVIPEQSMLFRAQGPQVALVGADNKVHLQSIKLGLNLGSTLQVMQGLKPEDRLIANPSQGLLEGQAVQVVHAPPQNTDSDMAGASGQAAQE